MNQQRAELEGAVIALTRRYPNLNWGAHNSRLDVPGRGHDWREYLPGEDARHIDHVATARQPDGTILVRTTKGSHLINAMLVVDLTETANWGGHEANDTKINVIKSFAEGTAMLLTAQHDSFGWLLCGERISYVRPRADRRALPMLQAELDNAPVATSSRLAAQLQHVSLNRTATKLVVVMADVHSLDDPEVQAHLKAIGSRRELVVIGVADAWDRQLPDIGKRTLRFGELQIPNLNTSDPAVQAFWQNEVVEPHTERITSFLGSHGVHYHEVRTDRPLMNQFTSIYTPPARRRRVS